MIRYKNFCALIFSIIILIFAVSCTKSGALSGGSSGSGGGSFSGTLTGSVNGGLSPISGGLVALYALGSSSPLATATTSSSGAFSINYTNPGGSGMLYLTITGGNAGGGTNANIQLAALLGQVTNVPSSIVVNELTTAAFVNVAYNYGALQDSNGTVTFPSINSAGMTNMQTQYSNLITTGGVNGSLSTANQNALAGMANMIAACIESSTNCSTLFNNAQNVNQSAAVSIQDSLYNMVNAAQLNLTNLYKLAATVNTGFTMPGSNQTLLNIQPIVTNQTISSGGTYGIAIDASQNVWLTNYGSNKVIKLNNSGSLLGTFSTGAGPVGIAIDNAGNVWIANGNTTTVTELNNAGSTLGTFTVGSGPQSVAIDLSGNIWVDNFNGGTVTELTSSGTTIGTFSCGSRPVGIQIDNSGNVWVVNDINSGASTVTKLNSSGAILASIPVGGTGGRPEGIAIDQSGNVWIGVQQTNSVVKLNPSGVTLSTTTVGTNPQSIAIDAIGNVWSANAGSNTVSKVNPSGSVIGTFSLVNGTQPSGIAMDASGNVWMTGIASNNVSRIPGVTLGPQFFPYSGPQFPKGF